jgi:hypothetical protein
MKHAPVAYVLERVAPAAPSPELNPVSAAVASRHDQAPRKRSKLRATRADNGLPAPVPEIESREDFADRFRSEVGRDPSEVEAAYAGPRCWA